MTTYRIQAPDGKTYRIDGPEGATQEQVQQEVVRQNPHLAGEAGSVSPTGYQSIIPRTNDQSPGGVGQFLGNTIAGGIRGAGTIGASIIRPFESAQENAQRRAGMDEALQSMGAEPDSWAYQGGRFAGEVAGTAGVGGVIAKPVMAAAKYAPALGKYLTPIATSLQSGGFNSGLAAKGAPAAARIGSLTARVAGGAGAGVGTAAMTSPDELSTGATTGAALAIAAPVVIKKLAQSAGFLADAFAGKLTTVKAGALAREAAGERIGAIRAALQASPSDLTAAQSTYGIQRDAWQALGKLTSKTDETSALLKKQASDDLADLQRLAEGGNATEARAAYEASIQRLNKLTADMRNVELQAANQANQSLNQLAPKLQQREDSAINALRQGMPRPTPTGQAGIPQPGVSGIHAGTEALQRANVADDAARRLMVARSRGARGVVSDGPVPGVNDKSIERTHRFVSEQWQGAADDFANIAKQRRAEARFIERQIGSLESHGLKPLNAQGIVGAIDAKLNAPGLRASPTVTNVLQTIKDDILTLTERNGGAIDAHDLYTLRKEGINDRIMQILGQTNPKVSAKVTRKVLGDIRPLIDDAIEQAGGTGWREYLKTYSQGMQSIDQKAMAAEAAKLFKNSPQEYVKLVRGENPDAVEAIFGPGSYDIFKEMSSKMPTLEKVASNLERAKGMDEAAEKGSDELGRIIQDQLLTAKLPSRLNLTTTSINSALNVLENRLNKSTFDKLRKGMASGQSALEMLNTLPTAERVKALKVLADPSTWGKTGSVAASAVVVKSNQNNQLVPNSKNSLRN